eukprot:gene10648-35981_t
MPATVHHRPYGQQNAPSPMMSPATPGKPCRRDGAAGRREGRGGERRLRAAAGALRRVVMAALTA